MKKYFIQFVILNLMVGQLYGGLFIRCICNSKLESEKIFNKIDTKARDKATKEHFCEFENLNFPES